MKTTFLTIILLSSMLIVNGQTSNNIPLKTSEDRKYFVSNVISGGVTSGIIACFNKTKKQKLGKTFFNAFKKGCVGGSVNYASKKLLQTQEYKDNIDWKICWSSKILNSVSNTILYTAATNSNDYVGNYSLNIGFIRLSVKNKVQIDPVSLLCMGYIFTTDSKLNWSNTLKTGTPVFDTNFKRVIIHKEDGTIVNSPRYMGRIIGQNIMIQSNVSNHNPFLHEIIHTYQRLEYTHLNKSFKIYNKLENIGFIHNDISMFDILYLAQNKTIGYNNNYFETEANYFSEYR